MAVVPAFTDGWSALRTNPVIFVGGLLVALGMQLQNLGEFIASPIVTGLASLGWLLVFPFVLGGFIGMAREALEETETSFDQFLRAGRTYYVRILLGTILFVVIVMGVMLLTMPIGLTLGIGFSAVGAIDGTAGLGTAILFTVGLFLLILAVIMFIQFYDTAIVIENKGVTEAFSRSVHVVKSNFLSVVVFSVLWVVLLNVFFLPDYLLQTITTETGPAGLLPIDPNLAALILVPIGIVATAIGFAYFYTVYTAYYLQLVADSFPADNGTELPT